MALQPADQPPFFTLENTTRAILSDMRKFLTPNDCGVLVVGDFAFWKHLDDGERRLTHGISDFERGTEVIEIMTTQPVPTVTEALLRSNPSRYRQLSPQPHMLEFFGPNVFAIRISMISSATLPYVPASQALQSLSVYEIPYISVAEMIILGFNAAGGTNNSALRTRELNKVTKLVDVFVRGGSGPVFGPSQRPWVRRGVALAVAEGHFDGYWWFVRLGPGYVL